MCMRSTLGGYGSLALGSCFASGGVFASTTEDRCKQVLSDSPNQDVVPTAARCLTQG